MSDIRPIIATGAGQKKQQNMRNAGVCVCAIMFERPTHRASEENWCPEVVGGGWPRRVEIKCKIYHTIGVV